MSEIWNASEKPIDRRSFVRGGVAAAGVATLGAGLLAGAPSMAAQEGPEEKSGRLTKGDAAILRFLAAAEIIETDLWQQYNELGGVQDSEVPGGSGNLPYTQALQKLDMDMPQYIHDNTEDEMTHELFINAFLASKGADTVDLSHFKILDSSKADGAQQIGRVTNLMQLTVDTSWWTRYRSGTRNPDFGDTFPSVIAGLAKGQHPAIPRNNNDLSPTNHLQAIANTAGFHFGTIEQGGTSLYPQLAQRVTDVEVLRVVLSIGPTEAMHFQTWSDKAGNAIPLTDPNDSTLVFPDLTQPPPPPLTFDETQANLIMPEPTIFLRKSLGVCSIIRPTATEGAATAVVKFLTDMGLFIGQIPTFFELMQDLAEDADEARRGH